MPFQGGICPEQFHRDQIQNGRLAAIIDFNMRNMCRFREGYALNNSIAIKFKMGDLRLLLTLNLICLLCGKLCQIAIPLL